VDRLHIHIQNIAMKPLAIALSGEGVGWSGVDSGGNLTNVQSKANQNCHS
jgi:hypothetical protein